MIEPRAYHWLLALTLAIGLHGIAVLILYSPRTSPSITGSSAIQISLARTSLRPSASPPLMELSGNTDQTVTTDAPRFHNVVTEKADRNVAVRRQKTGSVAEDTKSSTAPTPSGELGDRPTLLTHTERRTQTPENKSSSKLSHRFHRARLSEVRPGEVEDGAGDAPPSASEAATTPTPADASGPKEMISAAISLSATDVRPYEKGAQGQQRDAVSDYLTAVRTRFISLHRYPKFARRRGQQGTTMVKFVVDRRGGTTSAAVIASSGHRLLDAEALALIERASPLPPFPTELNLSTLEIKIPVAFKLVSKGRIGPN